MDVEIFILGLRYSHYCISYSSWNVGKIMTTKCQREDLDVEWRPYNKRMDRLDSLATRTLENLDRISIVVAILFAIPGLLLAGYWLMAWFK